MRSVEQGTIKPMLKAEEMWVLKSESGWGSTAKEVRMGSDIFQLAKAEYDVEQGEEAK